MIDAEEKAEELEKTQKEMENLKLMEKRVEFSKGRSKSAKKTALLDESESPDRPQTAAGQKGATMPNLTN